MDQDRQKGGSNHSSTCGGKEILRKFISQSAAGAPPLNIKGLITCSIGVTALLPPIDQQISHREVEEGLIKAADSAMYESKRNGKNRVTCTSEINFKK